MNRTQFTFYESFYKALARIRKDADRARAYDCIVRFALYGEEPDLDALPDSVGIAFEVIRPNLVASRKKAEGGSKGKRTKDAAENGIRKRKDNDKIPERYLEQEKEQEKEQVQVQDKEQMLLSPPPSDEGVGDRPSTPPTERGGAVDAYMRLISPTPSMASMRELLDFEREMDTGCCLRAIDAALDANARSWNYVKTVLESKKAQGVKTVEDWDRLEAQRMDARHRKTAREAAAASEADAGPDLGDLDWALEEMRRDGIEIGGDEP